MYTIGKLLTLLGALLAAGFYLAEKNLESFYVFGIDELQDVVNRSLAAHGDDTRAVVEYIVSDLSKKPELAPYVNVEQQWMFNNAGGAMGAMTIIHASITEYLIIFGSAVGTEGHTGRHTADDYFYILRGEEWAYVAGEFDPEIYPPGSCHHLHRGDVKQYKMPNTTFALEYARGWIPPMLFFGFADGFTSTLDFPTMWVTTAVTGRLMIGNLLQGKF